MHEISIMHAYIANGKRSTYILCVYQATWWPGSRVCMSLAMPSQ